MIPYELVFSAFAFFLGACIGSFLNVCIYRMPLNLSVNEPKRSFCPSCKYQIPWYRNLPLISWLSLRGKCANCGAKIAFRYFGVELLTGLLFLAVWQWSLAHSWLLALPMWVMVSLFIVATFIDFEHFIIPDEITWGGTAAGVLLMTFISLPMSGIGGAREFFSGIPGFVVLIAGIWLGLALGGPLRDMRSPKLFFLCSLGGAAVSLLIDSLLGGWVAFSGTFQAVVGAILGYLLVWGVVEGGKLAFGKKRVTFDKEESFTWTRHDDDADLVVGEEKSLWSDYFARPTDRMIMKCAHIEIERQRFENVEALFLYDRIEIAGKKWELIKVDKMSGALSEITIPREAMGFGDVKYMACIGAFLGWKAVIFTLVAASMIGAVVGVATIVMGKREWSAKIPFGPYLSVGAMIWLFWGPQIVTWYWDLTHPVGLMD